jgi:hypothetical protein
MASFRVMSSSTLQKADAVKAALTKRKQLCKKAAPGGRAGYK